jgi:hypothetical protein
MGGQELVPAVVFREIIRRLEFRGADFGSRYWNFHTSDYEGPERRRNFVLGKGTASDRIARDTYSK